MAVAPSVGAVVVIAVAIASRRVTDLLAALWIPAPHAWCIAEAEARGEALHVPGGLVGGNHETLAASHALIHSSDAGIIASDLRCAPGVVDPAVSGYAGGVGPRAAARSPPSRNNPDDTTEGLSVIS